MSDEMNTVLHDIAFKMKLIDIEKKLEYDKWRKEIPFLKFNPEWEVKIIPPYHGAIARFVVKYKSYQVSVYLDCYDTLGVEEQPYWEIFPYDGECCRVMMNESEELIQKIHESFWQRLSHSSPREEKADE